MNGDLDVLASVLDTFPLLTVPNMEHTFGGSIGVCVDGKEVSTWHTSPTVRTGVLNVGFDNFEGSIRGCFLVIPGVASRGVCTNFESYRLPLLHVSADLGKGSQCYHIIEVHS